jgi:hypothetical protein
LGGFYALDALDSLAGSAFEFLSGCLFKSSSFAFDSLNTFFRLTFTLGDVDMLFATVLLRAILGDTDVLFVALAALTFRGN